MRKMRTVIENMACEGEVVVVCYSPGHKLSHTATILGPFICVQNFCSVINAIYLCNTGCDEVLTKLRRLVLVSWPCLHGEPSLQGSVFHCRAGTQL